MRDESKTNVHQEDIFRYNPDAPPNMSDESDLSAAPDDSTEVDSTESEPTTSQSENQPQNEPDSSSAADNVGHTKPVPAITADSLSTDVVAFALGMFEDSEVPRVRSAITSDPKLYAELATMESVAGIYSQLAPRFQINRGRSAGIRSRLIARAASDTDSIASTSRLSSPRKLRSQSPKGAIASGAEGSSPYTQGSRKPKKSGASQSKAPFVPPVSDTPRVLVTVPKDEYRPVAPLRTPAHAKGSVPAASVPSSEPRVTSPPIVPARASGAIRAGVWIVLAIVLAAIVGFAQEWRMKRQQQTLLDSVGARNATLTAKVSELEENVFSKDSAIKALVGQRMRVVPLHNYGSKDPIAKVYWNQVSEEWAVYTYDMAAARPGKTYQIWLVTNISAPISLGTFTPKQGDSPALEVRYSLPPTALTQVLISEEPIGGSTVRTGSLVLAGR